MDVLFFLGVFLLILGVVLFFVQRYYKGQARSLQVARNATVVELQHLAKEIASEIGGGSWQDYVKLSGIIRCDRPLLSELKQEPCAHYHMTVSREYEETVTRQDSEGNSQQETRRGSETLSNNQRSIPFYLEDQTGRIEVNPEDAGIETVKVLDEFRPDPAIGGMISYGGFSLVLGTPSGNRRTLGYRYSEFILPVDQRALVVGMISDQSGSLILQKPAESQHRFIISLQDEASLARMTGKNAKIALYSTIACLGLGTVLLVIGLLK